MWKIQGANKSDMRTKTDELRSKWRDTHGLRLHSRVEWSYLGNRSSDFGVFMSVMLEGGRSIQTTQRQLFPVFECEGREKGRELCKPWKKIITNLPFSVYIRILVSAPFDISSATCAPKLLLLTWKWVHVNFPSHKNIFRWFWQHVNAQLISCNTAEHEKTADN